MPSEPKILPDIPSQILDTLSDAIAVFDANGRIGYSNEAFKTMEKRLFDPAEQNPIERLYSLISGLPRTEKGIARKPISVTFGRETFDASIHSLNDPGRSEEFYLVVLKLSDKEEALSISTSTELLLPSEALSPEFREIKGEEAVFKKALITAQKAAQTDFPVLIIGESGTGKEILARAIHKAGRRTRKNFVDINCAAIPENLIESELFGYEKGAFTGADPKGRRGLFEEAHGGSIFLDEIGDASLQIQSKVLRVLEEGSFKRVGGNQNIKVDVRHISATNRDLTASIKEGKFRQDLFYRLNTITIKLPPLRMRPNDIPLLIEHFVMEHANREGRRISFSSDCLDLMESYTWPGNVRELKGVLDYALTMAAGSLITPDCLPSFLLPHKDLRQPISNSVLSGAYESAQSDTQIGQRRAEGNQSSVARTVWRPLTHGLPSAGPKVISPGFNLPAAVREVEKALIKQALEKSPSRSEAIKTLGISRRTFYMKIKQYGLA